MPGDPGHQSHHHCHTHPHTQELKSHLVTVVAVSLRPHGLTTAYQTSLSFTISQSLLVSSSLQPHGL